VVVLYQIFARDGITLSSLGSFSVASGILHPSPPKKNEKEKKANYIGVVDPA
jgi:hypothetical protein